VRQLAAGHRDVDACWEFSGVFSVSEMMRKMHSWKDLEEEPSRQRKEREQSPEKGASFWNKMRWKEGWR